MQLVFWGSAALIVAAVIVWLIGFLMDVWDPTPADMERWGFRALGAVVGLALISGFYLKQKGKPFFEDSSKCACTCKTTICEIPVQK
jgi:hypothetical protein